ncbi:helicase HerA domain-containing protein [Halorubrum sp. DTA98]|uniref:helicase HerA domain-containing protein n=1 Tax=Halorubrum sp. DTA98 TaxID=3402163 RepID=UPI003AB0316E
MTTEEDHISLDESGDTTLPIVEILTGRGFITGKSGSGKSNTASVVVEELLDRGFPVLAVDTDGEYWGLKEEYEILHVGADEECDLQVGPEHAEKLAELALEDNVPIILDVSGFLNDEEANALVRETAAALFTKEKKLNKPFLMLLEECHEYLPEGGALDETGEMLIRVAKRGRKRGLGLCGISQRPADVKKDFITQCDWLMWHRLTWDNDTKVVRRVIDAERADAVQDLGDGEAFLMADFLEADVQRVQVRRKRTFDAGATPDLGEFERPDLKSVGGDLVEELEAISEQEQQRQDRIAQLEAEIEAREDTIEELRDELEQARDMTDMAEQFSQALMSSAGGDEGGEALQAKIDEIRDEKNARITELEQENEALRDDLRKKTEQVADLEDRVADLEEYEQAVENMDELREAAGRMNDALGLDTAASDEKLRERLEQREERVRELESEVSRLEEQGGGVSVPTDYEDFLEEDVVQDAIEDAKDGATCSPRYVKGVVAAILEEGGEVDYDTIAEYLGVSTTSDVSKASSALQSRGVVQKTQQRPAKVDFDLDSVAEIKEKNRRRDRAQDIMEEL